MKEEEKKDPLNLNGQEIPQIKRQIKFSVIVTPLYE